ncbi:c-type cytochrome [Bdellovibrio sp. HCB2-146]|uniref:c-type cytochrome n=1 Tax=Bdellovibrio sp. HCB2-146 TaxID=3394362 RepID=UPI0039BD03CA
MKNFVWILSSIVLSASVKAQELRATSEVDIKAGSEIAQKGTSSGVAACIACHGPQGEGNAVGGFPRLAGLPHFYMVEQLKDYSSGVRTNEVMAPIAKMLTDTERANVSAYYESLTSNPIKPAKKSAASVIKRGETLAKIGDQKLQLQACNNCHGPGGVGMAPAIPALNGQLGVYIESQLTSWKDGKRKNSPTQMMGIAQKLSDADIKALAAYFEQAPRKLVKK